MVMVETLTATGKLRHVLLILSVATVGVGKKKCKSNPKFPYGKIPVKMRMLLFIHLHTSHILLILGVATLSVVRFKMQIEP